MYGARVSAQRHRRSLSLLLSPLRTSIGLSPTYLQIPNEPLNLSVLKLDGSSFVIEVAKTATVAELRLAVQAVFSHMPQTGPGKISWQHLWGSFCLCYEGQKLVTDADYIKDFGIRDGDQLRFIRHVSTGYNLVRKKSKKKTTSIQYKRSLSLTSSFKEINQADKEDGEFEDIEVGKDRPDKDDGSIRRSKFKLSPLLGGWLLRPQVPTLRGLRCLACTPRSPSGLIQSFRNIIQICREKHYNRLRRASGRRKWVIGI